MVRNFNFLFFYFFFEDIQYFFGTSLRNWPWAVNYCSDNGGRLPEVRTQEDYDRAMRLRDEFGSDFWLGANDMDTEGRWVWSSLNTADADLVDMDRFWVPGKPSSYTSRNCMMVGGGGFYDLRCDWNRGIICEKLP